MTRKDYTQVFAIILVLSAIAIGNFAALDGVAEASAPFGAAK